MSIQSSVNSTIGTASAIAAFKDRNKDAALREAESAESKRLKEQRDLEKAEALKEKMDLSNQLIKQKIKNMRYQNKIKREMIKKMKDRVTANGQEQR